MGSLYKATVLAAVALSSCGRFEVDRDIAAYGNRLPDYCENNLEKLQILEAEGRRYGHYLVETGNLGDWDGLLFAIMEHHFLWGDFRSVVRMGNKYASFREADDSVEYCIARFLIDDPAGREATESFNRWLDQTRFEQAFNWDASQITERLVPGFDRVQGLAALEAWASDSAGLDAILISAARLQKPETEKAARIAIVEALGPFLTQGARLDRFYGLANDVGPWPWDTWLNAGLLLERHALQSGDLELTAQLRAARRDVAERMIEAKRPLNWVACALNGTGVFDPRRLSKEHGSRLRDGLH